MCSAPHRALGAARAGLFAGGLPPLGGRAEIAMLSGYGAVAAFIYGSLQDPALWPFATGVPTSIAYEPGAAVTANLGRFVAFDLATSPDFDVPRPVTTAVLVAITGRPVLLALRRAPRRAAFEAPVDFRRP
jgi:energy-coupling factor transport system substrate-specific component